jgi:UDP-N-acetylglucosamine 3-dehydrogenase
MDEMDEIRVGLIGTGMLGAVHAASVAVIPGCRLTLVAADSISCVATLADGAREPVVVPADAVCDPDRVDAVVIATPTHTHAAYAYQAIEAGLPVFCEKPLSRTLAEANRIRELAARRGIKIAVGHVVRYFPEYAAARDLVRRGELGAPATARLARFNTGVGLSAWYAEYKHSGGVVFDMAIHDVDWCLWAFGPAQRVYAVRSGSAGREVASVTIRHSSGTISYVDASWRHGTFATYLEVCGTKGLYRVEGSAAAGYQLVDDRPRATSYLPPATVIPADDPYLLELRAAFEWFRGGEPPLATVIDACEAIRVVEAAEESIQTGAPVALEETAA